MVGTDRIADEIFRIAADFAHLALALQHIAVDPLNTEVDFGLVHIMEAEASVEQADAGTERTGCMISFARTSNRAPLIRRLAGLDHWPEWRPQSYPSY